LISSKVNNMMIVVSVLLYVGLLLGLSNSFKGLSVIRCNSPRFTVWDKNHHQQQRQLSSTLHNVRSTEELDSWLEDMIYSGDIDGFIRRRSKDVVTDDFLDFLDSKLESSDDEELQQVIKEIIETIEGRLDITDGLVDSGVVFEKRLDKILFTPPNQRKIFIEENKADMTLGFIDYIQSEMRNMEDMDSKVVMASILQMIGQVKQTDLLGSNAAILKNADASLGEQYAQTSSALADTTISPSLLKGGGVPVAERNEQILAGLFFSKNDILEDVLNNLHEINDDFVGFLQKKVDGAKDMDERVGLSSLRDTIVSVLERVKEADGSKDGALPDAELTLDQVKQRMKEVQMGKTLNEGEVSKRNRKFSEFSVQEDARSTFLKVLERFQDLPQEMTLKEAVQQNYNLCDYNFMELLQKELNDCLAEGANLEAKQYTELLSTINQVMVERIGGAQSRLDRILKRGNPQAMESEIAMMTRKGEVDEALVLLIEANIQQAKAAGAVGASEVLNKLLQRVNVERDRIQPDEQRLLRALLKVDDSEKRKGLLYEAFKPSKLQNDDLGWVDGPPLITPPAFINIVRDLISNFGNVDAFDIMRKSSLIIDEAQVVAVGLYGEGMSPAQQQRFMWQDKTMSVWDLANYEDQAMMTGEDVPWANNKYDNMNPEDVLAERVKKVGGLSDDD